MTEEPDPKGLIREAYRIEGIGEAECRSIFLDWALALPAGVEPRAAIEALLARHADAPEGHPMTRVLREGRAEGAVPRRRGGARRHARG
ncbi:hypothetical protein [Rhodosalinus sp.]|uniref:hypothetical protein n=1 Tax=Rhodosalinus sp. TaxID=2047741 RepID=UPI003562C0D2